MAMFSRKKNINIGRVVTKITEEERQLAKEVGLQAKTKNILDRFTERAHERRLKSLQRDIKLSLGKRGTRATFLKEEEKRELEKIQDAKKEEEAKEKLEHDKWRRARDKLIHAKEVSDEILNKQLASDMFRENVAKATKILGRDLTPEEKQAVYDKTGHDSGMRRLKRKLKKVQ